jgi:hypothetical protein
MLSAKMVAQNPGGSVRPACPSAHVARDTTVVALPDAVETVPALELTQAVSAKMATADSKW